VTAMHRTPIESKAISSLGYEATEQRLEIQFTDGGIFEYENVPPDVHLQFLMAPSKGQYFNQMIRGKFTYTRTSGTKTLS